MNQAVAPTMLELKNSAKTNPNPKTIAILKLGGIGDCVDLGVIGGGLRARYPDAFITAVVRSENQVGLVSSLFMTESCGLNHTKRNVFNFVRPVGVDRLRFLWWKRDTPIDWRTAWENLIQSADWDLAIDARPYIARCYSVADGLPTRIKLDGCVSRADDTETYFNPLSAWTLKLAERNKSTVQLLADSIGVKADWNAVSMKTVSPQFTLTEPVVVLSNGVDSEFAGKRSTKQWSDERFGQVADVIRKAGATPIQLGTKKENPIPNCLDLRGQTTIHEAAWIIKNSHLVVSIEGGLARIAALMKTPSVVLFTSTPAALFATPGSLAVAQAACPLKHGCFWRTGEWMHRCQLTAIRGHEPLAGLPPCGDSITVDMVVKMVDKALGGTHGKVS